MKSKWYLAQLLVLLAGLYTFGQAQGKVGIGVDLPVTTLHVVEHGDVLFGNDTTGGGPKLMWVPEKYAFRVGQTGYSDFYPFDHLDSTIWEYNKIGEASFASGFHNIATKFGTIAMGSRNTVTGRLSVALGGFNNVSGNYGYALGYNNTIENNSSISIGSYNLCLEDYSFAVIKIRLSTDTQPSWEPIV